MEVALGSHHVNRADESYSSMPSDLQMNRPRLSRENLDRLRIALVRSKRYALKQGNSRELASREQSTLLINHRVNTTQEVTFAKRQFYNEQSSTAHFRG
jgi:hypothetical protein